MKTKVKTVVPLKTCGFISFAPNWIRGGVVDRWREILETFTFYKFSAKYDLYHDAVNITIEDMFHNVFGAAVSAEFFYDMPPSQIREFVADMLDGKYGSVMGDE